MGSSSSVHQARASCGGLYFWNDFFGPLVLVRELWKDERPCRLDCRARVYCCTGVVSSVTHGGHCGVVLIVSLSVPTYTHLLAVVGVSHNQAV